MRQLIYVDCCLRGLQSRTRRLGEAFLAALPADWSIVSLPLETMDLRPLVGDFLWDREACLERGELSHPRFDLARQFAAADAVVMAAPLWDLSFPALLKIYIENVSVDGISFYADEMGLHGMCRGGDLVFLTTRGGVYEGAPDEMGSRYLEALQGFFGFDRYHCVAADGLDAHPDRWEEILGAACHRARELARSL